MFVYQISSESLGGFGYGASEGRKVHLIFRSFSAFMFKQKLNKCDLEKETSSQKILHFQNGMANSSKGQQQQLEATYDHTSVQDKKSLSAGSNK
jgi:hypothetical protein